MVLGEEGFELDIPLAENTEFLEPFFEWHGFLYLIDENLELSDAEPEFNPVLSGHYNGFNRALAQIQHESGAVRYKLLDSPMIPDWGDWIGDFVPYMVFQATSGSGAVELEKGAYNIEAVGGGGGGGGGGTYGISILLGFVRS